MKALLAAVFFACIAGHAVADPMQNPVIDDIQRGQDAQQGGMFDRGILTTKSTRDRIKWLEEKHDDILARHNDIEAIARKLRENGFEDQAAQLDQTRETLKQLARDLPKRTTDASFLSDLNDFFSERGPKGKSIHRFVDDLKKVDTQLDELADAVGVERTKLSNERAEGEERTRVQTGVAGGGRSDVAAGGDAGSSGGAAGGSGGGFYVEVKKIDGDAEFEINGTTAAPGVTVQPRGSSFTIRAIALTETRKRSRAFKPSANTLPDFKKTDHVLSYRVQSGNFDGFTTLTVKSESYDWYAPFDKDEAVTIKGSSGTFPAVKDDQMAFKPLKGGREMALTATGEVVWSHKNNRKDFNPDITETAGGTLYLVVIPK